MVIFSQAITFLMQKWEDEIFWRLLTKITFSKANTKIVL
jgi:hypothetical protein